MPPIETVAALRAALDVLLARDPRALRIVDRDLSLLGLDDPTRHSALRALCVAGHGRRVDILLDELDTLARHQPRLTGLLRDFGHVLSIRQADPDQPRPSGAYVLGDLRDVLTRPEKGAPRAILALDDPARAGQLDHSFEAGWQRAVAHATASPLGL